MAFNLPYGIPATEMIADTQTSQVTTALRSNVMQLYGAIGDPTKRAVLVSDLTAAGIASVNKAGAIVKPTSAAATATVSATSKSIGAYDVSFTFDARGGAATGTYVMAQVPAGTIVTYGWGHVLKAFAGGGSKISIGINATFDDIVVAAPAAGFTLGYHQAIQDGLVANFTAASSGATQAVIAVTSGALTDGLMNVFLRYYVSV